MNRQRKWDTFRLLSNERRPGLSLRLQITMTSTTLELVLTYGLRSNVNIVPKITFNDINTFVSRAIEGLSV